jgi:D-inositol-3-phosphate glycosyltransferase
VTELGRRLAAAGCEVEIFTRAAASDLEPVVELTDGVIVRHVIAGPFEGLAKEDLPGQLCALTRGVLRIEALHEPGYFDLVHSHYWLSGQVASLAAERWQVPLVHSMHTMAKVKNAALADDDRPEPQARVIGEEQLIELADRLVANTPDEARQLVELYGADPDKVVTVAPGVDLELFTPGSATASRQRLGIAEGTDLLLFVGRIQPLKAPDVLLRSVAHVLNRAPWRRDRLAVAIIGGPSGSGQSYPSRLTSLAGELGIADVVRFGPPTTQAELVDWYRAATVAVVPSYNESFGLVAAEAQACGTPVVAAAVGGLRTAVDDGFSGLLVPNHDPELWATVLERVIDDRTFRAELAAGALKHASGFGWDATAEAMLEVYTGAVDDHRSRLMAGSGTAVR